jgi:hypothetical protein
MTAKVNVMAEDNFRIRIKPDGTIYFFSQEMGEERMRLLREMIEDCLGPITETRATDGDGPGPGAKLLDKKEQKLQNSS